MPFAHALIEAPDGTRYDRGDEVDLSKFSDEEIDNLRDGGAFSEAEYDPAADESPAPDVVEIDGVKYVKTTDSAEGANDGQRA